MAMARQHRRLHSVLSHISTAAAATTAPTPTTQQLEFCRTEKDGHFLIVTLTRSKKLNALHPPAHLELQEVFNEFERDPELWVAIVTGEGRGFSAGNDLTFQASGGMKKFYAELKETGRKPPVMGFCGLTERCEQRAASGI
eukprot:COSAG01_NODE_6002_length_3907_cov_11.824055_1_plen_141_part_00